MFMLYVLYLVALSSPKPKDGCITYTIFEQIMFEFSMAFNILFAMACEFAKLILLQEYLVPTRDFGVLHV